MKKLMKCLIIILSPLAFSSSVFAADHKITCPEQIVCMNENCTVPADFLPLRLNTRGENTFHYRFTQLTNGCGYGGGNWPLFLTPKHQIDQDKTMKANKNFGSNKICINSAAICWFYVTSQPLRH